jgi:hypothetical protein
MAGNPRAQYEKDTDPASDAMGSANNSGEIMLQAIPNISI